MKFQIFLVIVFVSMCIALDEINLQVKSSEGMDAIYKSALNIFKNDQDNKESLVNLVTKAKIKFSFAFENFFKNDKTQIEMRYKRTKKLVNFIDFVFDSFNTPVPSLENKCYYEYVIENNKHPEVCTNYCFFMDHFFYGFYFPEDKKNQGRLFYINIRFEILPIIETKVEEFCRTIGFSRKCMDIQVKKMKPLGEAEAKAIKKYAYSLLVSEDMRNALENFKKSEKNIRINREYEFKGILDK